MRKRFSTLTPAGKKYVGSVAQRAASMQVVAGVRRAFWVMMLANHTRTSEWAHTVSNGLQRVPLSFAVESGETG